MKKTKIIIPAMGLLLLSTATTITGTVAWFSANGTVSATGMNVEVKSNASYLLIGNSANAATVKTGLSDTVAAAYVTNNNTEKACYPAAYTASAATIGGVSLSADSWYTASNGNSAHAADDIKGVKAVTEGDKDYMLTYKAWLTLSSDSEDVTTKSIRVTFALASGDDASVSAVVVIGSSTNKFSMNSSNNQFTTAAAVSLTKTTAVEVTSYVYIDGNSTNVYSDYINGANYAQAPLEGTVSLTFDLVDVPAANNP